MIPPPGATAAASTAADCTAVGCTAAGGSTAAGPTAAGPIAPAIVDRLTPVSLADRAALRVRLGQPGLWHPISAFHQVECGGGPAAGTMAAASTAAARPTAPATAAPPSAAPPSGNTLRLGAWNLERGLFPAASARLLADAGVELALLSELDIGMLRTGQAHTIGRIAAGLGQRYAYAVEFLTLAPLPPPAGFPLVGADNADGWHGNALLTALPLGAPVLIRLPDVSGGWDAHPDCPEPRVGTRFGLAATISLGSVRFVACSVHLEARSDPAGRAVQLAALLDGLDAYAGGLPVAIGGDLNTLVVPGQPAEALFALAAARGYDFTSCNPMRPTTRCSHWSRHPGDRQLDWFCLRGLRARDPALVPALGAQGEMLSDHDMIVVTLEF